MRFQFSYIGAARRSGGGGGWVSWVSAIALLTCPEHISTCPNFTVTRAVLCPSLAVSVAAQLTCCGGRCARHVPFVATIALATCAAPSDSCTTDPAPLLLVPHTATRASFCSTAPPENIEANATPVRAGGGGGGGGPGGCGGEGAGVGPWGNLPLPEQFPSIGGPVVFCRMHVHSVPPRPHARTSKAAHCGVLAAQAAQHASGVVTDVSRSRTRPRRHSPGGPSFTGHWPSAAPADTATANRISPPTNKAAVGAIYCPNGAAGTTGTGARGQEGSAQASVADQWRLNGARAVSYASRLGNCPTYQ
jgi:hypothetical protein